MSMKPHIVVMAATALFLSSCNSPPTSTQAPTAGVQGEATPAGQVAAPRPIGSTGTQDAHSVAFDPADSQTLYFGHHNGLLMSRDGGKTWEPSTLTGTDAMSLSMPATGKPYYATGHGVFFVSVDGGRTWAPGNAPQPNADLHGFGASPAQPDWLFAQVAGEGVWESRDGGKSWKPTGAGLPPSVFGLAVGLGEPPVVYVGGGQGGGVFRSTDGGQSWQPAAAAGLPGAPFSMTVGPSGAVFAATEAGLYLSTDQGERWRQSAAIPNPVSVAVAPDDSQIIVAVDGTGNVYRSSDGGQTW